MKNITKTLLVSEAFAILSNDHAIGQSVMCDVQNPTSNPSRTDVGG
jgi:hypothetical protein